jgi:hypothetical protein
MIVDWWERIRGIDRWPEARAVVQSVDSWGLPWDGDGFSEGSPIPAMRRGTLVKVLKIDYQAADGTTLQKTVWLFLCPALFPLGPTDDFYLQYAPNDPSRIYIRERTRAVLEAVVGASIAAALIVWAVRRRD